MVVGEAQVARPTSPTVRRRAVLLGASNLTLGFGTAIDQARAVWGQPLDVLAALGHGRSYGLESRVLGRSLPGILQSGLWPALAGQAEAPLAALITDVGNDIMYGATPAMICRWLEHCLDHLAARGARVVLTLLPLASVGRLSAWRYRFFRACLFSGCGLSLTDAMDRAEALQAGLRALARARGAAIVCPPAEWYGFDPIHIRRGARREAWCELLRAWREGDCPVASPRGGLSQALYLSRLQPERQRRFGVERCAVQPCGRLREGTTIALY